MNRTKIEYVDYTWNPITGCLNNCSYCYARKIAKRFWKDFNPTFHKERLTEPLDVMKPSRIFADSMSDFWSKGVKQEWRNKIWSVMLTTPYHTYFVLTKMPHRITETDVKRIPDNCFVGVSITRFRDSWRSRILLNKAKHTFVSLEPLLDNNVSSYCYIHHWLIVGGLTGVKNGFKPYKKTIKEIIATCKRCKIPLFLKNNLRYEKSIKQYPLVKI